MGRERISGSDAVSALPVLKRFAIASRRFCRAQLLHRPFLAQRDFEPSVVLSTLVLDFIAGEFLQFFRFIRKRGLAIAAPD